MRTLKPGSETLLLAAEAIRSGNLVVVPTETVYGLAANALDATAVRKVFEAKGRPSGHPLITHISDLSQTSRVVSQWPEAAQSLSDIFWPGPLTFVLPKAEGLPGVTTGGRPTAAVRMPSHKFLRSLIDATGVPLAAPSANLFTRISPTRVEHLDELIIQSAEVVIDGGPCEVGIESTVIDLSEDVPRLLRPGPIGVAELENVLGCKIPWGDRTKAPGSHRKHYSPKSQVLVVPNVGSRPGLVLGRTAGPAQISMPNNARDYEFMLYDSLHRMDALGLEQFWIESPPTSDEWEAVLNRLSRAMSYG